MPPVDAHVTFTLLPFVIDVAETFEVFVSAVLTVRVSAFLTIVPEPSFTFTLTSYLPECLGVKETVVVVL